MRHLIAEFWYDGEPIACWTSEQPGKSGPAHLKAEHGTRARWWWRFRALRQLATMRSSRRWFYWWSA